MTEKTLAALAALGVVATIAALSFGDLVKGSDGIPRRCKLPIVPAALVESLGLPAPTDADGKEAGDCIEDKRVDDYLHGVKLIGVVLPKWQSAGLKPDQCLTFVMAVEWSEEKSEALMVCGPPPDKMEEIEKVASTLTDPGWYAEITSATAAHAVPRDAKTATLTAASAVPVEAKEGLPCACCARGQECTVDGKPGKPVTQYRAEDVTGAGKRFMPCGISCVVAQARGLNSTFDPSCL